MAQFTPSRKTIRDFNDGEEYLNRIDVVQAQTVNNLIEGLLYAQDNGGGISATDKQHLDAMWNIWTSDGTSDTLVNKVEEVLAAFDSFKEGDTIVELLSKKADKESFDSFVTLDTSQTISGEKTFSATIDVFSSAGASTNHTIIDASKIVMTTSSGTGGTTVQYGIDGIHETNAFSEPKLFSFPNKTGTLALLEDISNVVTTDTEQIITGHKTFFNGIKADDDADAYAVYHGNRIVFNSGGDGEINLYFPYQEGEIALKENVVTIDTQQTILGQKTFDDRIRVSDGESVSVLSVASIARQDADGKHFTFLFPKTDGTLVVDTDLSYYVPQDGDFEIHDLKSFKKIQIGLDGGATLETNESGVTKITSQGGINLDFSESIRGLAISGSYGSAGDILVSSGESNSPSWKSLKSLMDTSVFATLNTEQTFTASKKFDVGETLSVHTTISINPTNSAFAGDEYLAGIRVNSTGPSGKIGYTTYGGYSIFRGANELSIPEKTGTLATTDDIIKYQAATSGVGSVVVGIQVIDNIITAVKGNVAWSSITGRPTIPDVSNYVTLNTAQYINGQKTFDDGIFVSDSDTLQTRYGIGAIQRSDSSNNTTFTYSFPSKTGTFALTSDIHPIGSVYISYTSTSPASMFGGSWTSITGVFPYFNAGTSTGGNNTHTLTESEVPQTRLVDEDTGRALGHGSGANIAGYTISVTSTSNVGALFVSKKGKSVSSFSTMPKYQTFYAWRRTA